MSNSFTHDFTGGGVFSQGSAATIKKEPVDGSDSNEEGEEEEDENEEQDEDREEDDVEDENDEETRQKYERDTDELGALGCKKKE